MGEVLARRLKQTRFESSHQEVLLNLLVAADYLKACVMRALPGDGLSVSQYNVLRILRGAGPEGRTRCEIAVRMLDRNPDVTRTLDRLDAAGMVQRCPGTLDRRTTVSRITAKGLGAVDAIDGPMRRETRRVMGRLTEAERFELSRLVEKLYGPDLEAD
ncbi:MAG: MarR family transcriptional regulator [Candidatus Eisenbacteria bacterium]|nr:MarR family transcriptional regulator [Candidatus Eisenbacteria bacterium]